MYTVPSSSWQAKPMQVQVQNLPQLSLAKPSNLPSSCLEDVAAASNVQSERTIDCRVQVSLAEPRPMLRSMHMVVRPPGSFAQAGQAVRLPQNCPS